MPGPVLGLGGFAVNKTDEALAAVEHMLLGKLSWGQALGKDTSLRVTPLACERHSGS